MRQSNLSRAEALQLEETLAAMKEAEAEIESEVAQNI